MKTIINNIKRSSITTTERLHPNRLIVNFYDSSEGLWNGVKRYAH